MFNAVFYVLCIVHEALNQTKIKHDEMSGMWEDMQQQLRVAKAKAAMEKRLREESLASVEAEREELQNVAATLKEEMTAVRKENQACYALLWCRTTNRFDNKPLCICEPGSCGFWCTLFTATVSGSLQSLAAALECEMESFNSKMKAREEATAFAQQGLQAELESARDDCDDLQRQLRMAERNLARLRRPKACLCCSTVCHVAGAAVPYLFVAWKPAAEPWARCTAIQRYKLSHSWWTCATGGRLGQERQSDPD